jgi:hypothetical protein
MKGQLLTRVLRGGAWNNQPQNVACAIRNRNNPDNRNNNIGFRCAKTPPGQKEKSKIPNFKPRPVFPESGGSRAAGSATQPRFGCGAGHREWNNGCSWRLS